MQISAIKAGSALDLEPVVYAGYNSGLGAAIVLVDSMLVFVQVCAFIR